MQLQVFNSLALLLAHPAPHDGLAAIVRPLQGVGDVSEAGLFYYDANDASAQTPPATYNRTVGSPGLWRRVEATSLGARTGVASYAALRALPSGLDAYALIKGSTSTLTGINGLFAWDASSTATDDGATVIKPSDVGANPGRWFRLITHGIHDVRWYGAQCDNSTDDTAAWQAALDNYANWSVLLFDGTSQITAALTWPTASAAWNRKIRGQSMQTSIIKQMTANTPHIIVQDAGSNAIQGVELSDLTLAYNTQQTSSNTNAYAVQFKTSRTGGGNPAAVSFCTFTRVRVQGAYIAYGVLPQTNAALTLWGNTWLDCECVDTVQSAISWRPTLTIGAPRNKVVGMRAYQSARGSYPTAPTVTATGPLFDGSGVELTSIDGDYEGWFNQIGSFSGGSRVSFHDTHIEWHRFTGTAPNLFQINDQGSSLSVTGAFKLRGYLDVTGYARLVKAYSAAGPTYGPDVTVGDLYVDLTLTTGTGWMTLDASGSVPARRIVAGEAHDVQATGKHPSNDATTLALGNWSNVPKASTIPILRDTTTTTYTNMPAGLAELSNGTRNRASMDLSGYTAARLTVGVVAVISGGASAEFRIQYSADSGSTWSYIDHDNGGTGSPVNIHTTGTNLAGAWVPVDAAARADVWLRVVSINGDGSSSPQYNAIDIQAR